MKCPNCGTENKTETLFCEICGSALPQQVKQPDNPPTPEQKAVTPAPEPELTRAFEPGLLPAEESSPAAIITGLKPEPEQPQAPVHKPSGEPNKSSPLNALLKKSISAGPLKIPLVAAAGGGVAVLAIVVIIIIALSGGGGQNPITGSGFDFGGIWYDGYVDGYDIFEFRENGSLVITNYDDSVEEGKYKVEGEEIKCTFKDYEFFLLSDGYLLHYKNGPSLIRELPNINPSGQSGSTDSIYGVFCRDGDPNNWCLNFYSEDYMEIIDPVNGSTEWEYSVSDGIVAAGTGDQVKLFFIIDENTLRSNEGNIFTRYDQNTYAPAGYNTFYDPSSGLKLLYPDGTEAIAGITGDSSEIVAIRDGGYYLIAFSVLEIYNKQEESDDEILLGLMNLVVEQQFAKLFGSYGGIVEGSFENFGPDNNSVNPAYASMKYMVNTDTQQVHVFGELTQVSKGNLLVLTIVFRQPDNDSQRVRFNEVMSSMQFVPAN